MRWAVGGIIAVLLTFFAAPGQADPAPDASYVQGSYTYDDTPCPATSTGGSEARASPPSRRDERRQRVDGHEAVGVVGAVRIRGLGVATKTGTAVTKGEEIVGTTHNAVRPTQDWINLDQVDAYAKALQAGEQIEPIEIQRLPDGREFLLDGHHRYAASMRTGLMVPRIYYEGEGPRGFPDWTHVFPEEP